MKLITKSALAAIASSAFLMTSCGDSTEVEVVDLDVVLEKFESAAQAMTPVTDEAEMAKDDKANEFVALYTKQLNDAKLMKEPVGVIHSSADGSFIGFSDKNANTTKDAGEVDLFKVEVFAEENKLIASDLVHTEYRRDRHFSGTGFLAGYLISRMMFGQRSAGITSSRFRGMSMSKQGYHKSAVSSKRAAAARAKSARSSSGSKSFRSGK